MTKAYFIDSDIILDFLLDRAYSDVANHLFRLIAQEKIQAFTTVVVFANVHYILCKMTNKQIAITKIKELRVFLDILPVDATVLDDAIASGIVDFEDSIQIMACQHAPEADLQAIVTRNKKDFFQAGLPIMNANELIISLSN